MKRLVLAVVAMAAIALPAIAQETEVAIGSGSWRLMTVKDVMTDEGRGIASVRSADGGLLMVKCDTGNTARRPSNLYFSVAPKGYLGAVSNSIRPVMVRFDQDAPRSTLWYHSGRAAMPQNQNDSTAFIQRLLTAQTVAFRFTDFQGQNVDAVFDVAGSREAIEGAYAACGVAKPW